MSLIEEAIERLSQAVERLEDACHVSRDERKALGGLQSGYAEREHQLAAELASARADYDSLQLTSIQASGRIDVAIGRLKAILEA